MGGDAGIGDDEAERGRERVGGRRRGDADDDVRQVADRVFLQPLVRPRRRGRRSPVPRLPQWPFAAPLRAEDRLGTTDTRYTRTSGGRTRVAIPKTNPLVCTICISTRHRFAASFINQGNVSGDMVVLRSSRAHRHKPSEGEDAMGSQTDLNLPSRRGRRRATAAPRAPGPTGWRAPATRAACSSSRGATCGCTSRAWAPTTTSTRCP